MKTLHSLSFGVVARVQNISGRFTCEGRSSRKVNPACHAL